MYTIMQEVLYGIGTVYLQFKSRTTVRMLYCQPSAVGTNLQNSTGSNYHTVSNRENSC